MALRLHRKSDLQQLLSGCQNLFNNDIFSTQPVLVCSHPTQALWYKRLLAQYCDCSFALKDIRPSQLREFFQPEMRACEQPNSLVWLIWQTLSENSIFFEPIRKFLQPAANTEATWRYFLALSLSRVFICYRQQKAVHLQWWNEKRLAFDPLHRRLEEMQAAALDADLLKEAWQLDLWLKTMHNKEELECIAAAPPLLLLGSASLLKPEEFDLIQKYAQKQDVDYFLCEGLYSSRERAPFVLTMQALANEQNFLKSSMKHYTTAKKTLLAQLQNRLQGHVETELSNVDDSLRFFSCAGQVRQCEVLKNQLLCWLDEHPQSKLEDIAIVAAQIEPFTAALEQVLNSEQSLKIPHYFSSRQLSLESFFFDAFFLLLGLKENNFSYDSVQQLFMNRCFKSRFPLEKRQSWCEYSQELSICYGYDIQDIACQKLDVDNSWRRGWQRFFNKNFIHGNQNSSLNLSTLADYQALIETLEELYAFLKSADGQQSLSFWLSWLETLLNDYLCAGEASDLAEEKRLRRALERLRKSCATLIEEPSFHMHMLANLLKDLLAQDRLSERRPWTAGVCCASIAELHTLPFKVVFVLGADEGQLPRLEEKQDFDFFESNKFNLISEAHLFRHLILSATQKIAFFFNGCNAYSGEELSPALFIEQLWQFLEDEHEKGEQLLPHLLEEHPLQSFSERYFQHNSKLFNYSKHAENCFLTAQKPQKTASANLRLAAVCNREKLDWKVLSKVLSSASKFFWQRLFPHFHKKEPASGYLGRLSLNYYERQEFLKQVSDLWWQQLEQTSLKDIEAYLQELGVLHPHFLSKRSCENFLQDYEDFLKQLHQYQLPQGEYGKLQFCLLEQWGKGYEKDVFIRPGVLAGTDARCQIYGYLGTAIMEKKTMYKLFHYSENLKIYPAESLVAALLSFASCPNIDYFHAYVVAGNQVFQRLYSRSRDSHGIHLANPQLLLNQITDVYFQLLELPLPIDGGVYKMYPKISTYLHESFRHETLPELPFELTQLPLDRG